MLTIIFSVTFISFFSLPFLRIHCWQMRVLTFLVALSWGELAYVNIFDVDFFTLVLNIIWFLSYYANILKRFSFIILHTCEKNWMKLNFKTLIWILLWPDNLCYHPPKIPCSQKFSSAANSSFISVDNDLCEWVEISTLL